MLFFNALRIARDSDSGAPRFSATRVRNPSTAKRKTSTTMLSSLLVREHGASPQRAKVNILLVMRRRLPRMGKNSAIELRDRLWILVQNEIHTLCR